ncbi:MAG: S8 family serine peptidase [Candidatus Lokiarchaeota archaeon]|nr:S8 family serine peptidase [Candidatus Lokiarchaeota archaeon]
MKLNNYSNEKDNKDQFEFDPELSSDYNQNIIVYFKKSSYNNTVIYWFEYYGGTIKKEWNNQSSAFSGFAGVMPLEINRIAFHNLFQDAIIETDEILEAQMNYASIQSGAVNSTWYLNGLKGDTNSSIAVLDSGVNPSHNFLTGDIIGWENFVNMQSISDDNGHGTLISSIISGTGTEPYNSSNPSIAKIRGNYSHIELFGGGSAMQNFTLKLFSFNASKEDSSIMINSTWNNKTDGILKLWFELYYNNTLVNYTYNKNPNEYYIIDHNVPQTKLGIYDIYLKYNRDFQSNPIFSFNSAISFLPEVYISDRNHFTGIANATKIVAYKILNHSGIGYTSDLISALVSIIQNKSKHHIVSVCLSVGTLGEDVSAVDTIINEVIKNGTLVVIAAGNKGVEFSDSLNRLAQNKNAIIVGAINDKDQVTSYSSMGKEIDNIAKPDIVAPGGSKLPGHRSVIGADGEFDKVTAAYGTSIATAIVSAAVNILIEAKWNNWNQWSNLNLTKWVKYIKACLLMTASETNLEREDDPSTTFVESDHSPSLSVAPLTSGLKDIHEGYGRLNIEAAIDALTKNMRVGKSINGNLTSSQENPLGTHVFARQIDLIEDNQYNFSLSVADSNADFDIFLFSNESNQYGEPLLLESSRKWYGDFDNFYFTPKDNQTNCVIIVKAIEGKSDFILNISTVKNNFKPELKVPEINYLGGSKNTTIMSFQEFMGYEPKKNYSIDSYRFYIEYFDNDTSNVPPQEVYVSILETFENYTLTQFNPADNNYTDGALFMSDYIQFPNPGIYNYYFIASDGKSKVLYPETEYLNITIVFPTDSIQFPNRHDFNDGIGNWTYSGTGWGMLQQNNTNDDRSRIYQDSWKSLYFGIYYDYPKNYTYQPISTSEDAFPNGTLVSPLFNLTNLNENTTQPFVKFGFRASFNAGDTLYLQINLNWTGWITLRIYSNIEQEWFMEEINLTQYIGNFIQFRFETSLDDNIDTINYKGFILDCFAIENYTNVNIPTILFNLNNDISSIQGSKYQKYSFSCEYFDLDNNYPSFVYLEMDDNNFTLYNLYGDWKSSSNDVGDTGIYFSRSLILEEISNKSFRFHVSDGKNIIASQWYNTNNSLFEFKNPDPLEFTVYKDNKFIGYYFSNSNLLDYYVTGIPTQKEITAWFGGDNTWHPIIRFGSPLLYGGMGQSYGSADQGYGSNWNTRLITHPLHLEDEYNVYLEFDYEISLQNEFYVPEDQLDKCIVSISKDFGETWIILREFIYENDDLSGSKKYDISQYSNEDIMINFTLYSNDNVAGIGYGWLLSNIYIGYDKSADFIAPEIQILNPEPDITVKSLVTVKAFIFDNVEVDNSRIYILLNNKSVDMSKLNFNSTTSILVFNWDTIKFNDGTYELKVIAYDKEGNKAEAFIIVTVNNMRWWQMWGPYIIIFIIAIVIGGVLFILAEKKGKVWIENIKNARVEKVRLKDIDKDQVIKHIELIEDQEELTRPLTLYCKSCRSWFLAMKFDMVCPECEHDQIYAAYNCSNCGKFQFFDEPGENYYCKSKSCEGVRLIRRETDEIQKILNKEGKVLRQFKTKKRKFSILDI